MKFPRLKNAVLCRFLIHTIVLGVFIVPIIIVACMDFISEDVKIAVGMALGVGLIIYLIKNFVLLMTMDVCLALQNCHNTARKRFTLPKSFSHQNLEKRISRFRRKAGAYIGFTSPRNASI